MADAARLEDTLPAIARLALAYAPARSRLPTLALLALDARLAGLIRNSREPMLAQLRLAWWRETLLQPAQSWPEGDVLLQALRSWGREQRELAQLVEGWEALTAPAPLGSEAIAGFAEGRGKAAAALARQLGCDRDVGAAHSLGRIWGLEDLAMRLGREDERSATRMLLEQEDTTLPRAGRPLRSMRVLAGLARRRRLSGSDAGASSPGAVLEALKLGLLGW